jgi:hypothetical protein
MHVDDLSDRAAAGHFRRHGMKACGPNSSGPVPAMPDQHSNDANAGTDKSRNKSPARRRELRGKLITVAWAAAVLIATAGWLYFIVRTAWSMVRWLFR